MRLTVAKIGNHQTVSFAIKELCRLVKEMDETVTLDVRTYASYNAHLQNILWVGLGFIPLNEKDTIAIDVKTALALSAVQTNEAF